MDSEASVVPAGTAPAAGDRFGVLWLRQPRKGPPAGAGEDAGGGRPRSSVGLPKGTLPDVLGRMETDRFLTIYKPKSPSNGKSTCGQRAKLFSYEKANPQRA